MKVDMYRVDQWSLWHVIVKRGRNRGEDNHVRAACELVTLVTHSGIQIEHDAADYHALRGRRDVCSTCRPEKALPREQLELGL